jgi:hypothetical protein
MASAGATIRAGRRAPWIFACVVLFTACSNKPTNEDGGPDAGCDVFDAGPLDPNLVSQGYALVQQYQCQQCHGTYLEGNSDGVQLPNSTLTQYPPNLTPDPGTGLGCWTNEQVENAILNSVDNQGAAICGPMPHFTALGLSQADVVAIVTYLRSLPAESINVPDGPSCACNTDQDCPPGESCVNQACTCLSLGCALPGFATDGGELEDGGFDAGSFDAGPTDGGVSDAGHHHGFDAGDEDGGHPDGGIGDAGQPDGGIVDAGQPDGGDLDAGFDAGLGDAGTDGGELSDAGSTDAGPVDGGADGGEADGN